MAAVSCTLSEEQFLCSICLEVFTDPVTTPCGHSFCKLCLNKHWDSSHQYNCPVCKQDFTSRPQIKVNTVLAAMVFELKNEPQVEDIVSSELQSTATSKEVCDVSAPPGEVVCNISTPPGEVVCDVSTPPGEVVCDVSTPPGEVVCDVSTPPGEVVCDHCPEPRLRALKSCLVCLASYCQSHLQPHLTNPCLKRHQLIQPVFKLEERICPEHDRPLELFCRDHSHFICLHCMSEEHKDHQVVPLKEEGEVQQATLKEQIKERLLKIEEIRHSVELSQRNADTEIQEGVDVCNTLMECVQQSLEKFKESIVENNKKNEEEAAQLIEQIQTEISALEQRGAEMEQLWSSGDHLQFVQTFKTVKPAPQLNDWTEEDICSKYSGMLAMTMSKLKEETDEQMKKVFVDDLKRFQEYTVHVTLDDNTAHPNIRVECYSSKAQYTTTKIDYPNNYERFSSEHFVLGQQTFSSGRFYFEVTVKGSRNWAVGVVKKSVRRKGDIDVRPYRGFYLIEWDSKKTCACKVGGYGVELDCMPGKIGVFVDYEEGVVSFFDVYKAVLIRSIKYCSFTGELLPRVSPGDCYGAMQITSR